MTLSATKQLPAGLPEVLRAAHDVFINLTTDRILQIEALTVAINKGEDPEPAVKEIAQVAHKIAGVAGTLGYPDIGDLARSVEQSLKADILAGMPLQNWSTINPAIEDLLDAMENVI
ncbi:MAG: Hpt domain-containing protein [Paracoccaceae bacterium]|jgi:HPt (histidine-containing phosphotransfer) domain-containing protein|nr:Hpt domain-containing protein [Paracoccaceae bacterium]MDP5347478.1 Hpt domain-containing protein [Paracoccaceae bacterium]MDP5365941.1 Hpt domain-containing protein [Paracoccaceae bacterium]